MIEELIVRLVPTSIWDRDPVDKCVVMADILRASTTMVNAIHNGVKAIYPQAEIEDSFRLAKELGDGAVLGGERGGKIIEGFDLGNSPLEYSKDRIANKNLVLCTTNGTYTLQHCRGADRVLIGAFVNLDAVCHELSQSHSGMIACAGTNRLVTDEDVLFAGAVIERLLHRNPDLIIDDAGKLAWGRWKDVNALLKSGTPFWEILSASHGGRNLVRLSCQNDIEYCSQIDSHTVVPQLDMQSWIVRANSEVTL
ncbi:MAG: 2-phosphosulfolactate phosphatase [Planctomycetota bacterium]